MPLLGLGSAHTLDAATIDSTLPKKAPGNYALGDTDKDNVFKISRVGRSDTDLNAHLHDYIGDYRQFKAAYANSVKAAFEKECENYHDFKPPRNTIHPDRPEGTDRKCPRCNALD